MTMIFEKVMANEPSRRQAVFRHEETGDFFLYSCVKNDMADETMVFRCDPTGAVANHTEIVSGNGYVSSSVMMDRLEERLNHKCEMNDDMSKWHDMKRATELYKKSKKSFADPYWEKQYDYGKYTKKAKAKKLYTDNYALDA